MQRRRVTVARRRLRSRSPYQYVQRVSSSPRRVALGAALLLALGPAGLASAATKSVSMGVPLASANSLHRLGADANAFFPASIRVHRGDKVRFVASGFHDVDLPAKGKSATGLISHGAPIAGDTDAAGAPYWFNGQPDLQYTPSLLRSSFGRTVSYSGARGVASGLPTGSRPKPFTVKFTKSGTFTYYCNVHPGMKGRISVVSPKTKVPSAKADAKAVKKQVAAAVKTAKALQTAPVATDTIQVGNGGPGGVEVFAFYPGSRAVTVGTVLTFETGRLSVDQHTVTTGPGDPRTEPGSFLGRLTDSLAAGRGVVDQAAINPSDPRGSPALLNPNSHGNGFWNSGFMDSAGTTEFAKRFQVKFVSPGTYSFYCLIHPTMKTVVTVG
jgi:plastocyanin